MSQPEKDYDFGKYNYRNLMVSDCDCGRRIQLRTQPDNDPEYYTDALVKCDCGKWVKFVLPVN